ETVNVRAAGDVTLYMALNTRPHAAKEFDESKHPREPAGSPTGGRFAGGEGGGEGKEKEPAKEPKLDPEGVNVGGDQWNQDTAVRLEREYQLAKPALNKVAREAVGKDVPQHDDDDEEAPHVPDSWDTMSDTDQEATFEKWKEDNFSQFYDSEVNSWHEGD